MDVLGRKENELFEELKPKQISRRRNRWLERVSNSLITRLLSASLVIGSNGLMPGNSYAQDSGKPAPKKAARNGLSLSDVRKNQDFGSVYKFEGSPVSVEYKGGVYSVYPLINKTIHGPEGMDVEDYAELRKGWLVVDSEGNIVSNREVYQDAAYAAHMGIVVKEGFLSGMEEYASKLESVINQSENVDILHEFTNSMTGFLASLAASPASAAANAGKTAGKNLAKKTAEKAFAKKVRDEAVNATVGKTVDILRALAKDGEKINDSRGFRKAMRVMGRDSVAQIRRAVSRSREMGREGVVNYSAAQEIGRNLVEGMTFGNGSVVGLGAYYANPFNFLFHNLAIPLAEGVTPGPAGILADYDAYFQTHPEDQKVFEKYVASMLDFMEGGYTEKAVDDSVRLVLEHLWSVENGFMNLNTIVLPADRGIMFDFSEERFIEGNGDVYLYHDKFHGKIASYNNKQIKEMVEKNIQPYVEEKIEEREDKDSLYEVFVWAGGIIKGETDVLYGDIDIGELEIPREDYADSVGVAPGGIYFVKCKDGNGFAVFRVRDIKIVKDPSDKLIGAGVGSAEIEWVYKPLLSTPAKTAENFYRSLSRRDWNSAFEYVYKDPDSQKEVLRKQWTDMMGVAYDKATLARWKINEGNKIDDDNMLLNTTIYLRVNGTEEVYSSPFYLEMQRVGNDWQIRKSYMK